MTDDRELPFDLPSVGRKKMSASFDGGRISSDGGVMVLAQAERRLGLSDRLAALIADRRDGARVVHPLASILRARILAIACGCEDANDLDSLRRDPAFKLACGRLVPVGNELKRRLIFPLADRPVSQDLTRMEIESVEQVRATVIGQRLELRGPVIEHTPVLLPKSLGLTTGARVHNSQLAVVLADVDAEHWVARLTVPGDYEVG